MNQISYPADLMIAGHCDGITCLKLYFGNVVLCNLAIKEYKLPPKSFKILPHDDDRFLCMELQYCYGTDYLGFGYDSTAKDYKVVRFVVYDESAYVFKAEVYTLGSNSWREIETKYKYIDQFIFKSQVLRDQIYFAGTCYWHVIGFAGEFILSFDMSDELFSDEILVPMQDRQDGRLGVWKESIALIITYLAQPEAPPFDMWVKIKDSGDVKDSWKKCFTIGPTEGVQLPLLSPFVFWKTDKLVMVTNDGRAVLNDLGTKTIKHLPIHFVEDLQAVVCTNSIVSIEGGNKLEGIDSSAFYGIETLADGTLGRIGPCY